MNLPVSQISFPPSSLTVHWPENRRTSERAAHMNTFNTFHFILIVSPSASCRPWRRSQTLCRGWRSWPCWRMESSPCTWSLSPSARSPSPVSRLYAFSPSSQEPLGDRSQAVTGWSLKEFEFLFISYRRLSGTLLGCPQNKPSRFRWSPCLLLVFAAGWHVGDFKLPVICWDFHRGPSVPWSSNRASDLTHNQSLSY